MRSADVARRLVAAVASMSVVAVAIATAATMTLLDAAESGDRATALRLLADRADPNALGPDGTTAIMWAASNDELATARALRSARATAWASAPSRGSKVSGALLTAVWNGTPSSARSATRRGEPEARISRLGIRLESVLFD